MQRQEAILQPDDEHDRKFQALGGMQGEERHAIRARIEEIGVARDRDGIEEAQAVVPAGLGEREQTLQGGLDRRSRRAWSC